MTPDSIYFDHAATTPLLPAALDAMLPYLREGFGNPSALYGRGVAAKNAIRDARATIAGCIRAMPEEVYFTSGGTESDNWALMGVARAMRAKGRHIVVSSIEHHAILNCCKALEAEGYEVTYLPVTSTGMIEESVLESALRDDTILVSIMLANNEIGTILKIPALSRIARKHGVLFHTDAVQAVGHITVDVKRLGVDLLSASAHKFNGPTGSGFLYIKSGTRIAPFHIGGQQEQNLRAGTENVAGIVGMAVALAHNTANMGRTQRKLRAFASRFKDLLIHYRKDIVYHGDSYNRLPGFMSISFPDIDSEALLHLLDLQGVYVSTGAACNSQSTEISHVLKAIGLAEEIARGTIRISFGEENTPAELLTAADKLFSALDKLA